MVYVGSKRRLVKHYKELLLQHWTPETLYVEPFAGGMNMISEIPGKRLANDINKYIIAMFEKYTEEELPDIEIIKVGKKKYREMHQLVKNNIDDDNAFIGLVGSMCTFGGNFYNGGYLQDMPANLRRNIIQGQYNELKKQLVKLKNIEFSSISYDKLDIPNNSIIYCDPPYRNTLQYKDAIDYENFYNWCEEMSKNNFVYISEYNMPEDRFECIKEVPSAKKLGLNLKNHYTEKLYVVRN